MSKFCAAPGVNSNVASNFFVTPLYTSTIPSCGLITFTSLNSDKQAELDAMKNEIKTLKSMLNDLASKITS